jgi:response regulator RpfG family c-di-GMP phosphodiesterase
MLRYPGNGMDESDELRFAAEDSGVAAAAARSGPWKILIVDDEEDVHHVTRLVLGRFTFEERPLQLMSAYSAVEARKVLAENPDVAVILLDVVMERDDAGLRLVRHLRQDMGNRNVRIILRTGQPGQAPEQEVVALYDINDYKSKIELTADKLCTSVTSALRSWRDICALEHSRLSLQRVLEASGALLRGGPQDEFAGQVFGQLLEIAGRGLGRQPHGFAARRRQRGYVILEGTGPWADRAGTGVEATLDDRLRELLARSAAEEGMVFGSAALCACCCGGRSADDELVFVIDGVGGLARIDRDLLQVYYASVSLAYTNASLTREVIASQGEMIRTLSDIVETRSLETANHVLRVGEMAGLLAEKAGLDEQAVAVLKLAAPMHDVGKVGIPDRILNKPGRLSDDEFAIMKTHAVLGHAILCKSKQRIMQVAARVALQHHERWDGTGYPRGLAGDQVSIEGRITAIVDVFDALSSRRVYRDARPLEEVLEVIRAGRGRHFDPELTDLFLANAAEFIGVAQAHPDETTEPQQAGCVGG